MTQLNPAILISGASGMIGRAIGHGLAANGFPIVRLVRRRPDSADELQWNPSANRPIEAGTEKVEGLRAAIHLSGANVAAHRWTPGYKEEMRRSRVQSTRALAEALSRLSQPPDALLVASATGIYGDRGDEILEEGSAPGAGFLAGLCRDWEVAADPARLAGIRVVHLRFGVVLAAAAAGGALGLMTPLFRSGLGGRLGSGRQWMSWITLGDLVSAVLFILENPAIAGAVNFTSPQPVTNAEFTRVLGRALHRPAILPAPAFALRLAVGEMADEALLASARVIPRVLVDAGFSFAHPALPDALAAMVD